MSLRPSPLRDWVRQQGAEVDLEHYLRRLQLAGAQTNLVGTLDPGRIWDELLLDAVASWQLVPADVATVADLGSGAGLPGLVWALLARSQGRALSVTLIEPRAKRVEFLQRSVVEMGLAASVRTVKATLGGYLQRRPSDEPAYDLVTSRAVFPLADVVEVQQPLSARYQLVHASVEDLATWQSPAAWRECERRQYDPDGARPRAYVVICRA